MSSADKLLILGYGNPLRGDDAFGWQAAERLSALLPAADVRALHQLTPELAEPVSRAARVVFIDAAREGDPGVLREESLTPAASGAFTHHLTPAALLVLARDLYDHAPAATLFTAAGESFGYEVALSPRLEVALSNLCRRLISWFHMNPYASDLAGRDPLDVIAATPHELESLVHSLGAERLHAPLAPGKWSPSEVLCHLADCEIAFAFRLRQALAETDHVIQPFDQDQWAKPYKSYPPVHAVALFAALRNWNVTLIRAAGTEARSKKVIHPERGQMTFQTLVETMAGHDLHHLHQFRAIPAA
jgi:hydrogenase maturation protease